MKRPRIGIDVRKLGDGGIGGYVRETLIELRRLDPEIGIVAFGTPGERSRLPVEDLEWVDVRAGKYSLAEHWVLAAAARRHRVDLLHAPHYVLPLFWNGPAVVTVHDLIHVLFPRTPLHALYARFMIRSACRRAARVLTVSERTAADLAAVLGISREKIRVVPNGVSPRFRRVDDREIAAALRALGVEQPYILFVGNALPHKNVPALVAAWDRLPEPRPALVVCGPGHAASRPLRAAIASAKGGERVRLLGSVDGERLVALYGGAELFASASLYEGFGLPLVEAMACGTPVLAPDAGAVPEVAGDAALLVPPQRVDLLADGMYRLLQDRELRKGLMERGLRRAARYSWKEAARTTRSVYEEVARP